VRTSGLVPKEQQAVAPITALVQRTDTPGRGKEREREEEEERGRERR
jgi:hypothetical protein